MYPGYPEKTFLRMATRFRKLCSVAGRNDERVGYLYTFVSALQITAFWESLHANQSLAEN